MCHFMSRKVLSSQLMPQHEKSLVECIAQTLERVYACSVTCFLYNINVPAYYTKNLYKRSTFWSTGERELFRKKGSQQLYNRNVIRENRVG